MFLKTFPRTRILSLQSANVAKLMILWTHNLQAAWVSCWLSFCADWLFLFRIFARRRWQILHTSLSWTALGLIRHNKSVCLYSKFIYFCLLTIFFEDGAHLDFIWNPGCPHHGPECPLLLLSWAADQSMGKVTQTWENVFWGCSTKVYIK